MNKHESITHQKLDLHQHLGKKFKVAVVKKETNKENTDKLSNQILEERQKEILKFQVTKVFNAIGLYLFDKFNC